MTKSARKGRVAPAAADATATVGPELTADGQLPLVFHCLAVEGLATSDGRTISPGVLDHRTLPISILAQYTNPGQQGGHAGAEVIGHLTEINRVPGPEVTSLRTGEPFPEGTFVWQGKGVADPDTTGGKLVAKGHLRGNSVDLSDVDYDESFADDGKAEITISKGTIAATTLCPIPAFADAYVQVGEDEALAAAAGLPDDLSKLSDDEFRALFDANPPGDNPEAAGLLLGEALRRMGVQAVTAGGWSDDLDSALVASGAGPSAVPGLVRGYLELVAHPLPVFRSAELGDDCGPCLAEVDSEWTEVTAADGSVTFAPTVAKRKRAFARGLAMKGDKPDGSDASYPIENQADLDKAAGLAGNGDADKAKVVAHIRKAARKLGLKLPQSLQAAAAPSLPSLALFSDPGLAEYTPITVGEPQPDGRREIVGHIATWSECHTGYTGQCRRVPHSLTDYARFATGAARCVDEDGQTRIAAVGHISMSRDIRNGGHAPNDLSEADTVAFYDNHCTAVADVAAGEDRHGIWVHGLTVPNLSEAEVDRLLSSPPSGDWRGYRGNLELCAILAVNTPGYVVPRARVASGVPVSLVAAGRVEAQPGQRESNKDIGELVRSAVREELVAAGVRQPDTTSVPLSDRKAAALRNLRRQEALAVVAPFDPTSDRITAT